MSTSIETLTQIVWEWGLRCFGSEHMTDKPMRALRLAEKCIEYAQTTDLPKDQLHKVVDTVYSRPVGNPLRELGGVMVCAAVCVKNESTLLGATTFEYAFDMEVRRILAKSPEDFAKRNEDKIAMGLDAKASSSNIMYARLLSLARRVQLVIDIHQLAASAELDPLGIKIRLQRKHPFREMSQIVSWDVIHYAKIDPLDHMLTDMVREFQRYGNEIKA